MGAGGSHNRVERDLNVENTASIQLSQDAVTRITSSLATGNRTQSSPSQHQVIRPNYEPHNSDYSGADEYWKRRIESLKKTHDAINREMKEEYDKAVTETAQMFKRTQTACVTGKLAPCRDQKSQVIKCYKENTTQPLLCAKYVNDFNDCVAVKRSEVMATGA